MGMRVEIVHTWYHLPGGRYCIRRDRLEGVDLVARGSLVACEDFRLLYMHTQTQINSTSSSLDPSATSTS
jgi:hypothetical protein